MLAVTPAAYRSINALEAPASNTPAHIIATVARKHDLSARDLTSMDHRRHVIAARVAAMRAVWTAHPLLSCRDLCRLFNRIEYDPLNRSIARKPLRDLGLVPGELDGLSQEIARLIEQVAATHGTTSRAIIGRARASYIIKARQAAIHAVRQAKPHLSSYQLGRIFGGRHHTSILSALKKTGYVRGAKPTARVRPRTRAIPVPSWAERAGLADDYRDLGSTQGEHEAARHCRALLTEQRRQDALDASLRGPSVSPAKERAL